MKKICKNIEKCGDILLFCLGLGDKTGIGKKSVDDGICDFSGQGK